MLLKDYLTKLKKEKDLSYDNISKLTDLPIATVKSVLTGRTQDPQLSTVSKIVYAMGGSLDDIFGNNGPKANSNIHNSDDVECLRANCECRIREKDEQIEAIKRDKRTFMIISGVLVSFIIIMLLLDILFGSRGWVVYKN